MGVGKELWTELVTRYNDGGDGGSAGLAPLYASDALLVEPTGCHKGCEDIMAHFDEVDKPFSDCVLETSTLIEEADTVVAEYTWRATNTGSLTMPDGSEIPAMGKTVELPVVSVITVKDGKIMAERDYADMAGIASQLGLMPNT
jgi:ketosteroid isomerase-like protein